MKLILSFFIPLLCMFHGVDATNMFDFQIDPVQGDEAGLGNTVLCYLIPCMNETLGWRNIFAPVAVGEYAETYPGATDQATAPTDEGPTVREQLQTLTDLLNGVAEIRQQNNGGARRYLRTEQKDESHQD